MTNINTSEIVAIAYMQLRFPGVRWERMSRVDLHREFFARLRVNHDTGRFAVAVVGSRQWRQDAAIGDGITSATAALVTRCETLEEAEDIAEAANDLQPGLLPGQGFAWVYEARPYDVTDYLSRQALQNGRRKCDRRIAG